jgi:hypothetical protein
LKDGDLKEAAIVDVWLEVEALAFRTFEVLFQVNRV